MNDCPIVNFMEAVHNMYQKLDTECRKGSDMYDKAQNIGEVLKAYEFNRGVHNDICSAYTLVGEVHKGLFCHLRIKAQHIGEALTRDLREYCKIAEEGKTDPEARHGDSCLYMRPISVKE